MDKLTEKSEPRTRNPRKEKNPDFYQIREENGKYSSLIPYK